MMQPIKLLAVPMRLHLHLPACLLLIVCLTAPMVPRGRVSDGSQGDSLKASSIQRAGQKRDSTFKLLPKWDPRRHAAGFQFIPTQPESLWSIDSNIEILPYIVPFYDKTPQIVKKVDPVYPDAARGAGLEGSVKVKITIDEKGRVTQVIVSKSDAEVFNNPALEAARQFVFRPAYLNGSPVEAVLLYTFHFKLRQE